MQFTTSLLSLLAATATALPSPRFQIRDTVPEAVYLCTGANFTGNCQTLTNPLNKCVDLPANLTQAVSAIRPNPGAECMLMQGHCNDEMPYLGEIKNPGIADLSTKDFDNMATSLLCLEIF